MEDELSKGKGWIAVWTTDKQ